jgi:prepilin-type N-terminal cleavage/methylation domain-containing protein
MRRLPAAEPLSRRGFARCSAPPVYAMPFVKEYVFSMKRRGFTLIEMLVVVAIIGICVTLTIPYFVEAQRGAALRSSAQTIIMTAKYARSMALLKQIDYAVLVDKGASQVELVSLSQAPGAADQSKFVDERSARNLKLSESADSQSNFSPDGLVDTNAPPPLPPIKSELVRDLEEGVSIKEMTLDTGSGREREISWIFFNRNGTSSGFKIRIEDARGSAAEIEMDGVSGLVKSKMLKKNET